MRIGVILGVYVGDHVHVRRIIRIGCAWVCVYVRSYVCMGVFIVCVCVWAHTRRQKQRAFTHTQHLHHQLKHQTPLINEHILPTYLRSWRSLANRLALISPYKDINTPQNTRIIPNQKPLKPPHTPTKSHY